MRIHMMLIPQKWLGDLNNKAADTFTSTGAHRDRHPVSRLAGVHAVVVGKECAGMRRFPLWNLIRTFLQLDHLLVAEFRPVVEKAHRELVEAVGAHGGLLDLAHIDTDVGFGPAYLRNNSCTDKPRSLRHAVNNIACMGRISSGCLPHRRKPPRSFQG